MYEFHPARSGFSLKDFFFIYIINLLLVLFIIFNPRAFLVNWKYGDPYFPLVKIGRHQDEVFLWCWSPINVAG